MPLYEALEHASTLLFYSQKLAMEAAMDVRGEQYAWAAHYLCEMGKAVVDDNDAEPLSEHRLQHTVVQLWEGACSRWQWISQHLYYLDHRHREQAPSHT